MQPMPYTGLDDIYLHAICSCIYFIIAILYCWYVLASASRSQYTFDAITFLLFVATISAGLGLSDHTTDQLYAGIRP